MRNIIDTLTKQELQKVKFIELEKDETLFHEDEICKYIGIVISGEIVVSSFSYNGDEIVYNIIHSDGMFGNNLIFSKEKKFKGNVISKVKTRLALINEDNLTHLLMNNEAFLKEYLRIESDFTKSLNERIKLLSFDDAEERFFYFLFINNNKIEFKSISSLATTLSLARETLSRLISKLVRENKIAKSKHNISKK